MRQRHRSCPMCGRQRAPGLSDARAAAAPVLSGARAAPAPAPCRCAGGRPALPRRCLPGGRLAGGRMPGGRRLRGTGLGQRRELRRIPGAGEVAGGGELRGGLVRRAHQLQQQLLGGGPAGGVRVDGGGHQPVQRGGQAAQVGRRGAGTGRHHIGVALAERMPAQPRVRDQRPPGEHVARRAGAALEDLLGRDPAGRAHHHAGVGVPGADMGGAGQAEVDDPRPGERQHHVGGLEIAVHEPGRVDRGERRRHAHGRRVQHGRRQAALLDEVVLQRDAVDVLGDEEQDAVVLAVVQHAGGAERGDLAGVGDLFVKARPIDRVGGVVTADRLERHQLAVGIARQIDRAHAARPDPAHQLVRADRRRILRRQRSASGAPLLPQRRCPLALAVTTRPADPPSGTLFSTPDSNGCGHTPVAW